MSLARLDSTAIDQAADPGKFVELACERAKEWLAQALEHGDIDGIVELKSQAEAIRSYTVQKQLGKDAQLSAAEIVRRAERGIGLAIRKGQEVGEIRKVGDNCRTDLSPVATSVRSPGEYIENSQERVEIYAVTDAVSDATFEEALTEAKGEDNLSRANVVRKVAQKKAANENGADENRVVKARRMAAEGYTSRQIAKAIGVKSFSSFKTRHGIQVPADAVVGRKRHHDSNRIVNEVVVGADALTTGLYLIEWDVLDPDQLEGWVDSLSNSLRLLNRFRKQLKEKTQ